MPKRTNSYHDRLIRQLRDPDEADNYLQAALNDSYDIFLKAVKNLIEAASQSRNPIMTARCRD